MIVFHNILLLAFNSRLRVKAFWAVTNFSKILPAVQTRYKLFFQGFSWIRKDFTLQVFCNNTRRFQVRFRSIWPNEKAILHIFQIHSTTWTAALHAIVFITLQEKMRSQISQIVPSSLAVPIIAVMDHLMYLILQWVLFSFYRWDNEAQKLRTKSLRKFQRWVSF